MGSAGFFIFLGSQFVLLLLAFRLRRHSSSGGTITPKIYNIFLAATLVLIAVACLRRWGPDWVWGIFPNAYFRWEFILVVLPLLYMIMKQSIWWSGRAPKNIVVCLDGTWNTPDQSEYGHLASTNVYKIFKMLKQDAPVEGSFDASMCKRYRDKQIAFYYNGVGNKVENSAIGQVMGGAFGMGAAGIVERAYLDVMRVYRENDRIFIFGFSRGAAIARLVARAIDQRGAPKRVWTLHLFGRHWVVWQSSKKQHDVPISVLGCWDTVGAFGISKNIAGIPFQSIDLLKDLSVPENVEQAYHMVALDETRDAFVPTLMEPDPLTPERIIEVWFSGNHSNVGGGFATDRLSDVTFDFLLKHISSGYAHDATSKPGADESWGLYLSAVKGKKGEHVASNGEDVVVVDPDPLGRIRVSGGAIYEHKPRKLPTHAVISDSVFARMTQALPVYAPQSLFDHNEELVEKRTIIETEVKKLTETRSLSEEECQRILTWSREKLSLVKWKDYRTGIIPEPAQKPETKLANDAPAPDDTA